MSHSHVLPKAPEEPYELWRCNGCGKEARYLSDSWSTVTVVNAVVTSIYEVLHFCLECRTDKLVLPPKETHVPAE